MAAPSTRYSLLAIRYFAIRSLHYSLPSQPDHSSDIGRCRSGLAQSAEGGIAVRLRELAPGLVGDQPMMVVDGRGQAEELLQENMRGGREEKVAPANHVGDALRGVVDD